jgi:acetyl-CoA carboxylase carboxyltransferase component
VSLCCFSAPLHAPQIEWKKELYYGDGVTGYGTINGRLVYVFAQILPFWWLSLKHMLKNL